MINWNCFLSAFFPCFCELLLVSYKSSKNTKYIDLVIAARPGLIGSIRVEPPHDHTEHTHIHWFYLMAIYCFDYNAIPTINIVSIPFQQIVKQTERCTRVCAGGSVYASDVFCVKMAHIEMYNFISLINSSRVFTSQSILSNDFCKQMNVCAVYTCVLAHNITGTKGNWSRNKSAILSPYFHDSSSTMSQLVSVFFLDSILWFSLRCKYTKCKINGKKNKNSAATSCVLSVSHGWTNMAQVFSFAISIEVNNQNAIQQFKSYILDAPKVFDKFQPKPIAEWFWCKEKSFSCGFHIRCTKLVKREWRKNLERIGQDEMMCSIVVKCKHMGAHSLIGNEYNMTEPWQMTFYGRFVCKQIPLDSIRFKFSHCSLCVGARVTVMYLPVYGKNL